MTSLMPPERLAGQNSWIMRSDKIHAALTCQGGMLGPIQFHMPGRTLSPFSIAPWHSEKEDDKVPAMLRALRGDFFCAPFGGNETPYAGVNHPPHGHCANGLWQLLASSATDTELDAAFVFEQPGRPQRIEKQIRLAVNQTCVYQRHILSGFDGPMPLGHHAMLYFQDQGRISTSPFALGQVFPDPFENPAAGGHQCLKPGATFDRLEAVPMLDGAAADLSRYPARAGFEDLVMLVAEPSLRMAWSAVVFPQQRYVWFALKDPQILASTVLWHSNGGRQYAPWNGRHRSVLGIEEVTANFHYGIAESAQPNPISSQGYATAQVLSPDAPTIINYIMGVVEIPAAFDRVKSITPDKSGEAITLRADSGAMVSTPVQLAWLQLGD